MSITKSYRVVGPRKVDGRLPGETYEADYSAEHEQYLITAGHVELVDAPAADNPPDEGDSTAGHVELEVLAAYNPPVEGDYTPEEGDA